MDIKNRPPGLKIASFFSRKLSRPERKQSETFERSESITPEEEMANWNREAARAGFRQGVVPVIGGVALSGLGFKAGRALVEELTKEIPNRSLSSALSIAGGIVGATFSAVSGLVPTLAGAALYAAGLPPVGLATVAIGALATGAFAAKHFAQESSPISQSLFEKRNEMVETLPFLKGAKIRTDTGSLPQHKTLSFDLDCIGGAKLRLNKAFGAKSAENNDKSLNIDHWSLGKSGLYLRGSKGGPEHRCEQQFDTEGNCHVAWKDPHSTRVLKVTRSPDGLWGPILANEHPKNEEWTKTNLVSRQTGDQLLVGDGGVLSPVTTIRLPIDPAAVLG